MDYKKKQINEQQQINAGEENVQAQAQVQQFSIQDFLGEDYAQLEEHQQQNLENDMAAGEALLEKKDILGDFEIIELPKEEIMEKNLDETFQDAYKTAHAFEKKTSKMKKSTLKKRRAEYAKKTEEKNAMRDVKKKVALLKNGPVREEIRMQLNKYLHDNKMFSNTIDDPTYAKMLDQLMYFRDKDGMNMDEMAESFKQMNLDIRDCSAEKVKKLGPDEKKDLMARFTGKMRQHERLFAEAMSWNIEDFAFKDNHSLAKDPALADKMKKLNLVPALKAAISEYKSAISDGMMKELRLTDASHKIAIPLNVLDELEQRVVFFDRAQADYQARVDLMSNKYYTLLGESDTASMDITQLKALGALDINMDKDPELVAYYNAVYRNRVIKGANRSIKGKKSSNVIKWIKKENNIKTDKKAEKALQLDTTKFVASMQGTGFGGAFDKDIKYSLDKGTLANKAFDFTNKDMLLDEIMAVNKTVGLTLDGKQIGKIADNFPKKLERSKKAASLLNNHKAKEREIFDKLSSRLEEETGKSLTGVREEREALCAAFANNMFKDMDAEEQYRTFKTIMTPFLESKNKDENVDKEKQAENKKASENEILKIFRLALKDNKQQELLKKFENAEDFADRCTQEEYDYFMAMNRMGAWVNQFVFEHFKDHQEVFDQLTVEEHKALYLKFKCTGYEFINEINKPLKIMANKNYAFIDNDGLLSQTKKMVKYTQSSEQEKAAHPELKKISEKKLFGSMDRLVTNVRGFLSTEKMPRLGEDADKRLQADEETYKKQYKDKVRIHGNY